MAGVLARADDRYLMRAPGAFDLDAVDFTRASPTFRCAQDQHRPLRALAGLSAPSCVLERANFVERLVECGGEACVRVGRRLVELAADDRRPPAVALEQRDELALGDAGKDGRIGDLVAVQMQHR